MSAAAAASVDLCCATASARSAPGGCGVSRELRTGVDTRSRRRTDAQGSGASDGSPSRRGGQPPDSARFVCGAMAVPHRFACVRRVANGSSGAASQREQSRCSSAAKLANDSARPSARAVPGGLGTDRSCDAPLVNSVRVWSGSAARRPRQTGAGATERIQPRVRTHRSPAHPCAARRTGRRDALPLPGCPHKW